MIDLKKSMALNPNLHLQQGLNEQQSQRVSTQHFLNTDFQTELAKQRNKLIHKQVTQKAFKKNQSQKFRLHNFDDHQHAINKAERLIELCQITDGGKNRTRSSMQQSNYYSSNELIKLAQRRYQTDEAPTYLQSTQSIQRKKRDKYILVQKKTKQRKLKEQKDFKESQNKWLKREPSLCSQDFNDAINARHQRHQIIAQGAMANFDPDLAKLMVTTKTNESNAGAKRNILTHIGVTSNFQ